MARTLGFPYALDQFALSEPQQYQTARARPYGPDQKDMSSVEPGATPTGLLPQTAGNWLFTATRRMGYMPFSAGRDLIFERIWVSPQLVAAGFITEELTYDISVWNAYQERSVEFTSVTGLSADGTDLDTPTLPHTITQSDDLILTLTINLAGPPIQATTYSLVVDAVTFGVEVTGIRVVGLIPDPNWGRGIMIRYRFETAMAVSPRFVEQRRPLMDAPYRDMTATYLLSDEEAHRFFYVLSYGHDKIFGLPIYNEKLRCSVIPNGGTTITTVTDTTNMYNLNNLSTHIAIVDHADGTSEIKEVSSVGANSIEVAQDISGTFDVDTTRVYPVVFATVASLRKQHATDNVETVAIEFAEFNNGG